MKLLEILLYTTLFAFLFSGYVIFAQNFSQYISIATKERWVLEKERLLYEYIRWNVHRAKSIGNPTDSEISSALILQMEDDSIMEIDNQDLDRFMDNGSTYTINNSHIWNLKFYLKDKYLVIDFIIKDAQDKGVHRELEINLLRLF